MCFKTTIRVALAITLFACARGAVGQHAFQNTRTVDPSGNADFTTIQAAVDDLAPASDRATVFIYAGEYNENVVFGDDDENIDLVGVDPHSVIIAPSTGVGLKIESGTETARNNSIRNLTILTTNNHGIEIVVGGGGGATTPKHIQIENVIIDASGTDKHGISGIAAEDVAIRDCNIISAAGRGIAAGNRWTISSSRIETEDSNGDAAVDLRDKDDLALSGCSLFGQTRTLLLDGVERAQVTECDIFAAGGGGAETGAVLIGAGSEAVRLLNCRIESDATGTTRTIPEAIMIDDITTGTVDVVVQNCALRAIAVAVDSGGGTFVNTRAAAIRHDLSGTVTLINCELTAINHSTRSDVDAAAFGIDGQGGGDIVMIGGSIATSSASEKEMDVYDILTIADDVAISDVAFSKWNGVVQSAARSSATIQRTVSVTAASNTSILAATALTGSEQSITSGITNPDVYRVISVVGNQGGMNQVVHVLGTDFAGNVITDALTLNRTTAVNGVKPFLTVTKVVLPAQSAGSQTVSVGTTGRMGLQFPIAATAAVVQFARKTSAATSYTITSLSSGNIDATYSTVDVGTVTGQDSFEFTVQASQ